MLAHRQGAAWRQAVIVIVSVALVVAAVTYCAVRPFDRDTLAIRVAQLRSQAAEAAMAARLANADRLAPGFVHAHAGQLLRKVESVDGELRAHPDGGMTARYRDATADASALSATIQRAPPSREPGTGWLVAIMAWLLILAGGLVSWRSLRRHPPEPGSARRFVAQMSLMAAFFFALMVGWQLMATAMLPGCTP
jgi:hypothetical protein